ncbi:IclR family transcriptional regulator domain-containing protein [Nocardia sp. R7R-8]|uniref:IclR family transcriptional regulator domain-containing protein n=1 Tax=Nocardia sp. R7R-8 TaxID=3459304 RepID=UPI00403DE8E9
MTTQDPCRSTMLERGVQILQAFRPHGGTLTLPTLVERTGLPKPTVHRLVEALVHLGMLERQPIGYRPGMALFELGELVPAKAYLREAALPFMQDLYESTHQTVHLGVRNGLDVVYAEKIRGHHGVDVPTRVGGRLPLTSTSTGKAQLAFAPPEILRAVLCRPLRRLTDKSPTDSAKLAAELAEVRVTGVAYDFEEAAVGVSCVAAPILVEGQVVGALSLAFPSEGFKVSRFAPVVRTVSAALSRALVARNC